MLLSVIVDAALAVALAFAVIYLLAFAVNSIFFGVKHNVFTLEEFITQFKSTIREEKEWLRKR